MRKIELLDCFGNMSWFIPVQRLRGSFANRAETTVTRTDVATEHECGCAIGPTFKNIRATSFLTNRMKVQTFNEAENVVLVGRIPQADLEPFRLGLPRSQVIADYAQFSHSSLKF
jgi:hypothetical protein